MSNCLVLQGKNFIAVGADTASSVLIDGKYKRFGTDAKKLYHFGNEIMFCSGKMELVELVISNIIVKGNKIVLDDLTDFIKSLNIEKSDTYDLEILICGVENGKSYMHQISQYNDFEVKTITNNTNGCAIYSTGFNAKTMLDTAKKNYPLCKNVSDLFIKSFTDISSEEVGGYINVYLVQENQITKCVDNHKVDDIEPISVSKNDIHYVVADCLIGDLIVGKVLKILNSNNTFTVDENGLRITNGINTIVLDPNDTQLMNVTNGDKKIFYLTELGDLYIDGNIFGGSLHLENDIGTYVDIDPDKENIMEIAVNPSVPTYTTKEVKVLNAKVTNVRCTDITVTSNEMVEVECNDTSIGTINENDAFTIDNLETDTVYKLLFKNGTKRKTIHTKTKQHSYVPNTASFVLDTSISSTYTFVDNDGVWTSNNQGVDSSTAMATWTMDLLTDAEYTFQYKVSSENSFDKLTIILDEATIVDAISGDGSYLDYTTTLTAGTHTLTAKYVKDSSENDNDDTAYLILPPIGDEKTLVCKYCGLIIEKPEVVFSFTGEQFNTAIKSMTVSSGAAYSTTDSVTKQIIFSEKSPEEYSADGDLKASVLLEEVEVEGSTYQFTVFRTVSESSSGIVRMYSNADKVNLARNMMYMFYNFTKVTYIDMSRFYTSHVTSMGYMFENCYTLTQLDLLHFDTSSVVIMNGMFHNCQKLIDLAIQTFDTSKVIYMMDMFNYCSVMSGLNLISFDTSSVTSMARMFQMCSKLSMIQVTEGKWVINNDTSTTDMFTGCGCSEVTYV